MKLPTPADDIHSSQKGRKTSEKNDIDLNELAGKETQQAMEEAKFPHYKRVSDYLLGTCVGEGSFAKVRVGFHCPTKEKVAVKIINKAKAKKDSYVFKNLHREGKIMQMLRHQNIVQVFDILETGNNYYLVTELCSGGELIDIVTEQGSLPEELVRKYTYQLVNAVAYMHDRKIVHRDLKVENLLLDSYDNLKIIDFGLSNVLPEPCSDISCALATQCGSPAYAAPELLAKKTYGPKVDVWSIGVITFALLVGKLPFTVEPFNIPKLCKKMMRGDMNPIPPYISPQCRVFIRKLLSPDQARRPSINDAMRLKWIAAYQEIEAKSSKNSVSSLLIDRLTGDSNIRRRHMLLAPLVSPPIDSSIVKDMTATYGFACSDIIQCVHKNRPGPLLATYHLLKKKKSKRSRRSEDGELTNNSMSNQHVDSEQCQPSLKQSTPTDLTKDFCSRSNDPTVTHDLDSAQSSQEDLINTPSLPKTCTPEQSNKTSANDVDMVSQEDERKEIKLISFGEDTATTFEQLNEKKTVRNTAKPTIDFRFPMPSHSEAKVNGNAVKTISAEVKTDGNQTNNKPFLSEERKYSSPANGFLSKNKSIEVNELLASMKKAREVLERRQKVQQRNRLNLTKPSNRVKPGSPHEQFNKNGSQGQSNVKSPNDLPEPAISPRKSLQVRLSTQASTEPRSISQQGTRQKVELSGQYLMQSPYSRPASHNAVLSKMSDSAYTTKRYVYTPNSPSRPRSVHDRLKIDKQDLNGQKSPIIPIRNKPSSPSTLPLIGSKAKVESKLVKPSELRPFHGDPKAVRRSFPASNGYTNGINRMSSSSRDNKSEPVNNINTKLPIPSKWQKNRASDTDRRLKNPRDLQHLDRSQSENATRRPTTHRPRKAISEPIAAAISYLTSTKNRAFRKEKSTSLSAS